MSDLLSLLFIYSYHFWLSAWIYKHINHLSFPAHTKRYHAENKREYNLFVFWNTLITLNNIFHCHVGTEDFIMTRQVCCHLVALFGKGKNTDSFF